MGFFTSESGCENHRQLTMTLQVRFLLQMSNMVQSILQQSSVSYFLNIIFVCTVERFVHGKTCMNYELVPLFTY